jgi:hypothetical protein
MMPAQSIACSEPATLCSQRSRPVTQQRSPGEICLVVAGDLILVPLLVTAILLGAFVLLATAPAALALGRVGGRRGCYIFLLWIGAIAALLGFFSAPAPDAEASAFAAFFYCGALSCSTYIPTRARHSYAVPTSFKCQVIGCEPLSENLLTHRREKYALSRLFCQGSHASSTRQYPLRLSSTSRRRSAFARGRFFHATEKMAGMATIGRYRRCRLGDPRVFRTQTSGLV